MLGCGCLLPRLLLPRCLQLRGWGCIAEWLFRSVAAAASPLALACTAATAAGQARRVSSGWPCVMCIASALCFAAGTAAGDSLLLLQDHLLCRCCGVSWEVALWCLDDLVVVGKCMVGALWPILGGQTFR